MAVERVAAIREAGGDDLDIIIEVHSLLDTNTAIELGQALEPYRIMYFEEPTQPLNPALFKTISSKVNIPLATGERSYTRWGFRQFFEDRSLSIIQPDICNTGGFTEAKKSVIWHILMTWEFSYMYAADQLRQRQHYN